VVVVVGADAELVSPALSSLRDIRTVVNDRWQEGLSSSLACGVRAVLGISECDGVLITLADQPLVDAAALRTLLDAFDAQHQVVASEYGGTVGVPAVFGRQHLDSLMSLTGDTGAGAWLRNRESSVTRVPLPAAAHDVDTREDFARLA